MQINNISDIKTNYRELSNNSLLELSVRYNYIHGIRLAKIKKCNLFICENHYLKLAACLHNIDACEYLIKLGLIVDNRVLSQAILNEDDDINIVKYILNQKNVFIIENRTLIRVIEIENFNVFLYLVENGYGHHLINRISDINIRNKAEQLIRKYKIKQLL